MKEISLARIYEQPIDIEKKEIEIKKITEQTPFRDLGVQKFLTNWFAVNDGVIPKYLSRQEWEEQKKLEILQLDPDKKTNKKLLYIPNDLHLWEMVDIMKVVDEDTYGNDEVSSQKKEYINHLGVIFKNSAIYIANRLSSIVEGKEIAEEIVEEFFKYGNKLSNGENQLSIEEISQGSLSEEETSEIDQWLAGNNLYELRFQLPQNDKEQIRLKTLQQFFRVSEKAYELKRQELKPAGGISFHEGFLEKVNKNITDKVEIPRSKLYSTIFERGIHKLAIELNDPSKKDWRAKINAFFQKRGINFKLEEDKIYDSLEVPKIRQELDGLRQEGDAEKISEFEMECARKVQQAVSQFTYARNTYNPVEILKTGFVNCVGFTMIGASLLKELDIKVLGLNMPQHLSSLLVTSNGKIYSLEMQDRKGGMVELKDEDLIQIKEMISKEKMVAMSQTQEFAAGVNFKMQGEIGDYFKKLFPGSNTFRVQKIETGIQTSILYSLHGELLFDAMLYESGEENVEAIVEHMISGGEEPIRTNNNILAAGQEAIRYYGKLDEFGDQINKDDIRYRESSSYNSLLNVSSERIKSMLDNLKRAKELQHLGHVELSKEFYRKVINDADVSNKEEKKLVYIVRQYLNDIEKGHFVNN